jgi:hypothetical protein
LANEKTGDAAMNAPQPLDARSVVSGVRRMTPSEAFVETLVAQGVDTMFGIMGSAFMDAMDIFAPAGIRLISVVHEQGAGHMSSARTGRASATASPPLPPPTGRIRRWC